MLNAVMACLLMAVVDAAPKVDEPGVDEEAASPLVSADGGLVSSPDQELTKRFERTATRMRQAQEALTQKQTGTTTQELQRAILKELDELLKRPPQPPSSSGGGGSSSKPDAPPQSGSSSSNSKPSGTPQDGPAGGMPQPAGEPRGSERERETAEDSEERSGERRTTRVEPLSPRRLEVDVWGHLPEKVRERLLNAYGERVVPQYESMIGEFYRSLAEPDATNRRK